MFDREYKYVPQHLCEAVKRVVRAPIEEPPSPWVSAFVFDVGGLTDVGFSRDSDMLLVVSHDGRGVFDCTTGARLARDRAPPVSNSTWRDWRNQEAEGIGPLAGVWVKLAGIHGGGLKTITEDGWKANRLMLNWPEEGLFLVPPAHALLSDCMGQPPRFTKLRLASDTRAFGFSPTGRTLLVATGSEVSVISRPGGPFTPPYPARP